MQLVTIPQKISPPLAEETGLHIGDGTMGFYNSRGKIKGSFALRGHLIDDRPHYDSVIKGLYKEVYGISISLREMQSTGVYGFQIWNNDLVEFKSKKLGLPLGKKMDITIPPFFLENKENKISVLRGIYDTDGCLYLEKKKNKLYPRIKFSTTSLPLIHQLRQILSELNLRATSYSHIRQNPNWRTLHVIEIRGETNLNKFFNIIKPNNQKHLNKYYYFLDNS